MEVGGRMMDTELPEVVSNDPAVVQVNYPATIKEMGWAQYLEALSDRLHGHLPDVIGGRAKKDIGNAAKVLRAFSELDIVTAYLDSLPDD